MASSMQIISQFDALRTLVTGWKKNALTIGLVPTMGALHAGHISLIDYLRPYCDRLIVSIFVNPTQFAKGEDFDSYPQTLDNDLAKLHATKTDLVYVPTATTMYGNDFSAPLVLKGSALDLESETRPDFFKGVATIVNKLLQQTRADYAIFGEKDYQQLSVIRQMVKDFKLPVKIIGAPIIREADGLAMSSRNVYLSQAQRVIAGKLNKILEKFCQSIANTENDSLIKQEIWAEILASGFDSIDYLEVRASDTLAKHPKPQTPRRALVVARLGDIRLLDNMPVPPL